MSFTIISTFSGCGGSSLGYQLAGGKILLACEWESNAAKTYTLNFPNTPLFHGDIHELSIEKIQQMTNIKIGELDILDGSPPCQGFSTNGKRKMDDNRNELFKEYCRILRGLKPKCFVMENVSGMVKGNMKFVFVEILKELKSCGYNVSAKLLNAKNYQVPQSRERIIFLGTRNDLNIAPSHPIGSSKINTIGQAFKNCPNGIRLKPKGMALKLAKKLKPGECGSKYHSKGHYFAISRLKWDKPSHTISKQLMAHIAFVFHPDLDESISIEELKRISSFPDDFQFIGKFEDQWARMGNCVPPLFMKAIALHIYENVLKKTV